MPDQVAAELIADFKSKGVNSLLDDYKKVHRATEDVGQAIDHVATKIHGMWGAMRPPRDLVNELTGVKRELTDIQQLLNKTPASSSSSFFGGVERDIRTAETSFDRFSDKLRNWRPSFSFGGGSGGGGGFNPLDLLGLAGGALTLPIKLVAGVGGAALGAVGSVAGAGLGLAGGVAGAGAQAAGAVAGFGFDQLTSGIGEIAGLDAGRAAIAAHMGTDYAKLPEAQRKAIMDRILNNAFMLSSAPETGKVNSEEALAAMDEAAKAGITDPTQMAAMAKTALQLRAAGGENKITTDNAMRLLITGKNAFGGKYSNLQVANAINGLVNATTLDISQVQNILKSAGAANISGMSLDSYLLEAGMMAQAGVAPGQIGGGIKQILQMSQPKTQPSIEAMKRLGLITTTFDKKGNQQVEDNGLWDQAGNIADPATFFGKLLKGTQGKTNEQTADLVGRAFNPKAAGYIEQVLGYYRSNPEAWDQLEQQIRQQSDVAATAAQQNDNLATSFQNMGDTIQNLKDKALLPLLDPLKSVVNQVTGLGQDLLADGGPNWDLFKVDLEKLKTDVAGKLGDLRGWLDTEAPRLLAVAGQGAFDITKILFGEQTATNIANFVQQTIPRAWNGAVNGVKDLVSFWDTKLKPLIFSDTTGAFLTDLVTTKIPAAWNGAVAGLTGLKSLWDTDIAPLITGTDAEKQAAIAALGGKIGDVVTAALDSPAAHQIGTVAGDAAKGALSAGGQYAAQFFGNLGESFKAWATNDKGKTLSPVIKGLLGDSLEDALNSFGKDAGGIEEWGGKLGRSLRFQIDKAFGKTSKDASGQEFEDVGDNIMLADGTLVPQAEWDKQHKGQNPVKVRSPLDDSKATATYGRPDTGMGKQRAGGAIDFGAEGGAGTPGDLTFAGMPGGVPADAGVPGGKTAVALGYPKYRTTVGGKRQIQMGPGMTWVDDPASLPKRAKGGDVFPGSAYLVGEEGPEVFAPTQAGTILPHLNPGHVNPIFSGFLPHLNPGNLAPAFYSAGHTPPPPPVIQVIINSYPGDTNRYSAPTVMQHASRDLENYGRISRPRS